MSAERTGNPGEVETLARRAVACRGWRWMPGMLTTDGLRIVGRVPELTRGWPPHPWMLPDLTDPATLGCVLALVREAFPTAPATTSRHSSWEMSRGHYYFWIVSFCTGKKWDQSSGQTEAAALVAALEAAP